MAPFSRVYELSENVVPAQGAEAIADTPGSVAPTTTSDKERQTDETDVTSLDSNKFNENDTRSPENRVDVTTLSHRRQQAKRSVPVPRLSSNAFSAVLQRIDRISSANPQADFDRAVVAGVQDYCYRTNQNTLNVLAAVVPTLVNSGNFDASDDRALRNLFAQVQQMRRQADGSMGDPGSAGDGTGGDGGVDPSMMGGAGGGGIDPTGGLSGPGGPDGGAGQGAGGLGMDPSGGAGGASNMGAPGDAGIQTQMGGDAGAPGSPMDAMKADPSSQSGMAGGANPMTGGGIAGPDPASNGGFGGGVMQGLGDVGSMLGLGGGGAPAAPAGGAPGPGGTLSQPQMLQAGKRQPRRAQRLAKLIMAGTLEFSQLSKEAQNEVRLWVTAGDDDSGGAPTTNSSPGSDENDQDNRQNPHNDGANSDSMVGDAPEYAQGGGGGTPDVDPNWKGSTRRRRRLADTNQEVAEKDTNRIDVQAPNTDTSDRAQQSQYDRGEYDQNGPLLSDPDKSTDQNWPPKASAVDAMRLADLYVAMNMVPAEKKYEIVAGFEKMNSWIVKDRLKVLGYVQKVAAQNAPRQQASGRNRSMVPQSSGQQQTRGGMPSMGRGASLNGHRSDSIDTHFLAL